MSGANEMLATEPRKQSWMPRWGRAQGPGIPQPEAPTVKSSARRLRWSTIFWRLAIVAFLLLIWQYVPQFPGVQHALPFTSPFFISSPSAVARELVNVMTGKNGVSIWGYVGSTLVAALVGTLLALLVGGVGGLICGGNARLYEILRPLIAALNAVPRIALIPIIVLIVGTSPIADLLSAALVGVFIVFYNALEGSRSVTWETVHSVKLLGASRTGILLRVRGPYTLAWIFASVPNTISFGLQGAVTAELFSGVKGVGQLLTTAVDTANSALTFATVVVVGVVGIILVQSAEFARSRLMGWWDSGGGAADR